MQKFIIKNIDCANCASKIEHNLSKLKEVRFVSVNFADSVMFIDTDNIGKVRKVIKQTEPEVEIIDSSVKINKLKSNIGENPRIRKKLIFIASVGLFYISALILHYFFSTFSPLFIQGFFLAAYLVSGWEVLLSAARKIVKGNLFDEQFLMSIATLGAIILGELPEAAGVMIFYQIGEFLQQLSVKRSRNSVKSLLAVRPDSANLLSGTGIITLSPEEVKVDDIIIVKPGEKVPLDGCIIEGHSQLDSSPLTGETFPFEAIPGSNVLAGMINKTGAFTMRVTRLFENSSVAKILELVENAGSQKAETEKFITKFSRVYTPIIVSVALAIAFIPPWLMHGSYADWIHRALVILVISCPCALVISIPLGYFGGIGSASRKGILIKGSNFLDTLAEVKTVIFDKTGTLTKGIFIVTDIVPKNGYTKKELLRFAAEAEQRSNHPVAQSIRQAFGKPLETDSIISYQEIPGYGIKVRFDNKELIAGNDRLLHTENIEHEGCNFDMSVLHIAVDKKYAGYILIADEMKEDAAQTIKYLRKLGIEKIMMFTGDNYQIAESIAHNLQLDEFYAELLPEEKVSALEKVMTRSDKNGKIAFIGDGINDAPVIARADVGIAMGALGTDLAIETADVVIMTDTPSKIGTAISLSKRTRTIVWQNIIFALSVKLFFIALGSLGIANMWEAVFGDMGVALIAILNSTRISK